MTSDDLARELNSVRAQTIRAIRKGDPARVAQLKATYARLKGEHVAAVHREQRAALAAQRAAEATSEAQDWARLVYRRTGGSAPCRTSTIRNGSGRPATPKTCGGPVSVPGASRTRLRDSARPPSWGPRRVRAAGTVP